MGDSLKFNEAAYWPNHEIKSSGVASFRSVLVLKRGKDFTKVSLELLEEFSTLIG